MSTPELTTVHAQEAKVPTRLTRIPNGKTLMSLVLHGMFPCVFPCISYYASKT